jgi:hypothetical protein
MRLIFAIFAGAGAAAISILLHQSLPPVGVLTALVISYCAIWLVGRTYGARRFKVAALIGWLAVILKAGSFGVGQELLVQGDGVGSTLLLLGTLVVLAAVAARL